MSAFSPHICTLNIFQYLILPTTLEENSIIILILHERRINNDEVTQLRVAKLGFKHCVRTQKPLFWNTTEWVQRPCQDSHRALAYFNDTTNRIPLWVFARFFSSTNQSFNKWLLSIFSVLEHVPVTRNTKSPMLYFICERMSVYSRGQRTRVHRPNSAVFIHIIYWSMLIGLLSMCFFMLWHQKGVVMMVMIWQQNRKFTLWSFIEKVC